MHTLILTDIHGNLPALEAVLSTPEAQTCQQVISLGDASGFGPNPLEVYQRLTSLHAVMLLGNHEERLHHMEEPVFAGYNWALARWTAAQLRGQDLHHPTDYRMGRVLMTHGTPGDPFHLIDGEEAQALLPTLPEDIQLVISGHNHIPFRASMEGRRWVNPGSLGMLEDETGSIASFALLTLTEEEPSITVHRVPYEPEKVLHAMVAQSLHRLAPEMCHAVYLTMTRGLPQYMLRLVDHVKCTAAPLGLSLGDEEAWKIADESFPWADGCTSREFWKEVLS